MFFHLSTSTTGFVLAPLVGISPTARTIMGVIAMAIINLIVIWATAIKMAIIGTFRGK